MLYTDFLILRTCIAPPPSSTKIAIGAIILTKLAAGSRQNRSTTSKPRPDARAESPTVFEILQRVENLFAPLPFHAGGPARGWCAVADALRGRRRRRGRRGACRGVRDSQATETSRFAR